MANEHEVVVAALGASTALAGLTLVFLGVVIAQREETPAGASRRVRSKYSPAAAELFATFLVGLATSGASFAWLAARPGHCWYTAVLVLFAVQLVATATTAGHATLVTFQGG
jgi:hypothetical protein